MLKRVPYVLGLVWAVILFVLPLPLIQTLAVGLPSIYASESLAIQVGVIAYVWILTAIYLSTRPRWLDRMIGLPGVYLIHGLLSIVAIVLAYLHKSGTQSAGWIKLTGDWAFDLFLGLMVYSLVFMAGWLTSRVPLLATIKRWLEQLFHHELSVWLHRLNVVAVVLVFIHVQLISYITSITPFIWLFNGYSVVVLLAYLYAKFRNVSQLPEGRLAQIRPLSTNFYELTITAPAKLLRRVRPGDYVFINFPLVDHLHELHPFSVVNDVTQDGRVVLAIRGDGDFTIQLQELSPGTTVRIDGGFGRFDTLLREHPDGPLTLIAGGSGVAPMLALIQAYPERQTVLYYSAHREQDLVYRNELLRLEEQRANLEVHAQVGRFDVQREVQTHMPTDGVFLLSGPAKMGRTWRSALIHAGVQPDRIYFEEFSW